MNLRNVFFKIIFFIFSVIFFSFFNFNIYAQTITPVARCGYACVDGSGNKSMTVACSSSACGFSDAGYCSALGNGSTFTQLSCCQDSCAGAFFQSPAGCVEKAGSPEFGCKSYTESIACNNACADGAPTLVPTPSTRDCTTNPIDYCGSPAKKCNPDTTCKSATITWDNVCNYPAGSTGENVNGTVNGTCGPSDLTCGSKLPITNAKCFGGYPAGSSQPPINQYIGVNSPVNCTIVQTQGTTRFNSAQFGANCAGITSCKFPASFKVNCSSGTSPRDNKNWNYTVTHNTTLGELITSHGTDPNDQTNFEANISIKYLHGGIGVEGTDNISVKVCDGGSDYQSSWANQPQANLPEYCSTVTATIFVDTRPPHLGFSIDVKDAKTIETTLTAQDTNLKTHSYYCSNVAFSNALDNQFDKIITPNDSTTCPGVTPAGTDAADYVANPKLVTHPVSGVDKRVIDYTFKENVKDQLNSFKITYKDSTTGWSAEDTFCNVFTASTTIPPLGYQDLRNGVSIDVGSPWLQTKGGRAYSQNGVNYTINDIDPTTCKVTDNTGNPLLTQLEGGTYVCPEARDDYSSTYFFLGENSSNSPRASKYGEVFIKSKLGKVTNMDVWSAGKSPTYYEYFLKSINEYKNNYKSGLRIDSGSCGNSQVRRYYNVNSSVTLNGGGDIITSILGSGAQRLLRTNTDEVYQPHSSIDGCDNGNKAIVINGNLTINTPVTSWGYSQNTILLVSGDVNLNGDILKNNTNSSLLIVARGNVNILSGKYSSEGKTANDYPGYDRLDLGIVSDGKVTTSKDDAGPVWDGLKVNGFVIASGMCPNDRGDPLYNSGALSSYTNLTHSGTCSSTFGRDLLLLQNFIAPSESIEYDPTILLNLSNVLGYRQIFDSATKYNPAL